MTTVLATRATPLVPWWSGIPARAGLYSHVMSRTDCNINDEEAGEARKVFAEEAKARRRRELARIAVLNAENRKRLLAIKAKTDDGDGTRDAPTKSKALQNFGKDELREVRLRIQGRRNMDIRQHNTEHRSRLVNMSPLVFDDIESPETAKMRARLRQAGVARRQAELSARVSQNRTYFARVKSTLTMTDSKIWDDGAGSAGAMRSVVAAKSRTRKVDEARKLKATNLELKKRFKNVEARVDDGDGHFT